VTPIEPITVREEESIATITKRIRGKITPARSGTAAPETSADVPELLDHIRQQLRNAQSAFSLPSSVEPPLSRVDSQNVAPLKLQMEAALKAATRAHNQVGELNPRLSGLHNNAVQLVKKAMQRSLTWYTRPLQVFQAAILRTLRDISVALQSHDSDLRAQAVAIQELRSQNATMAEELKALRARLSATPQAPADGSPPAS